MPAVRPRLRPRQHVGHQHIAVKRHQKQEQRGNVGHERRRVGDENGRQRYCQGADHGQARRQAGPAVQTIQQRSVARGQRRYGQSKDQEREPEQLDEQRAPIGLALQSWGRPSVVKRMSGPGQVEGRLGERPVIVHPAFGDGDRRAMAARTMPAHSHGIAGRGFSQARSP